MLFLKFFYKFREVVPTVLIIVAIFLLFGFVLKMIIEPLSPTITICFVVAFIICTYIFGKWTNTILPIGGLVLYVISLPVTGTWGVSPGMCVWSLGILLWSVEVYRSFSSKKNMAHSATDQQDQDEEVPEVVFSIGKPVTYIPVAVNEGGNDVLDWTDDSDSPVHHFLIPEAVLTGKEPVIYVKLSIKGKDLDERHNSWYVHGPQWKDGGLIERFYGFISGQEINPIENLGSSLSYRNDAVFAGSYSGYFTIEDAAKVESWLFEQGAIKRELSILFSEE